MISLNLWSWKRCRTQSGVCRSIKRDVKVVGLGNIESSSLLTKLIVSLALHEHVELIYVIFGVRSPDVLCGDSGRLKSQRKLELPTLGLESACWRSRQSLEDPTPSTLACSALAPAPAVPAPVVDGP